MAAWETYPSDHQFPLGTPHIRDRLPLGRTFFSPKFTASKFTLSAKNRTPKAENDEQTAVVCPSARQDDRAIASPTAPAPSLTQINPSPCASMVYPNNGSTTMSPTWKGFVHSTLDSLMIVEACLSGIKNHIPRRPHDRERVQLITSGSVFVYEENASGIKRWTDGITWSPSRIMGNYLVYRELKEPFPPGEKKRAAKRKRSADLGEDNEFHRPASNGSNTPDISQSYPNQTALVEEDRKLVGSLVDSYGFKDGGLLKKTISIQIRGVVHHVICYYTVADVKEGKLLRPSCDPELQKCKPRAELIEAAQNFRSPILNEEDSMTPNLSIAQAYRLGPPGQTQAPPTFTGFSGVDFGMSPYRDQRFASHPHPSMGAVFPGPSPTHNGGFSFTFGAASQPLYNINHYASQPLGARTAAPRNMAMVRPRQFSVPATQAQSYRPASNITPPPSANQPSIKRAYSTNSLRQPHLPADAQSNGSVYVSEQPASPQSVQQVPQQMYQLQSSNGSLYPNEEPETSEQQQNTQFFSQAPLTDSIYTPTDTEPVVKPEVSGQYSTAVTSATDHSQYPVLDLGLVDTHNSAVTSDNGFDFDNSSYTNLAHLPTPTSMSGRSDSRYDSVVEHNSNGATPVQTTVESSGSFKASQAPAYSFGSENQIGFDDHDSQTNQSYMRFNTYGGPVGQTIDTSHVGADAAIYAPYSA